jgi:1-acyl-sn-glycerol-3-phosphate acyltransferase
LNHLSDLRPPFLVAANHSSHLDVIAILATLPPEFRTKLAPAVRQEYFAFHFSPSEFPLKKRLYSSLQYYMACLLFNTFPLPQRSSGVGKALQYAGFLTSKGFCPLVFPEGKRTEDGAMNRFKPGIGLMAVKLGLPIVPVYLDGLFEIFSVHDNWPRKGKAQVNYGEPLFLKGRKDPVKIALRLEKKIQALSKNSMKRT